MGRLRLSSTKYLCASKLCEQRYRGFLNSQQVIVSHMRRQRPNTTAAQIFIEPLRIRMRATSEYGATGVAYLSPAPYTLVCRKEHHGPVARLHSCYLRNFERRTRCVNGRNMCRPRVLVARWTSLCAPPRLLLFMQRSASTVRILSIRQL